MPLIEVVKPDGYDRHQNNPPMMGFSPRSEHIITELVPLLEVSVGALNGQDRRLLTEIAEIVAGYTLTGDQIIRVYIETTLACNIPPEAKAKWMFNILNLVNGITEDETYVRYGAMLALEPYGMTAVTASETLIEVGASH